MATITERVDCCICDHRGLIENTTVVLRYTTRDPYAVRIAFGSRRTMWGFARDLLIDGMNHPAGMGDVLVRPGHAGVHVTLRSPSGEAQLTFLRHELVPFVDTMQLMVPRGREHEHVDLDAVLRALGAIA